MQVLSHGTSQHLVFLGARIHLYFGFVKNATTLLEEASWCCATSRSARSSLSVRLLMSGSASGDCFTVNGFSSCSRCGVAVDGETVAA